MRASARWAVAFLLGAFCLFAMETGAQKRIKSCRTFVRDFYNWYAARYDQPAGWLELLVTERSVNFSPELLAALRDYAEPPAAAKREISALDFDPILNAQDNADRYVAGDVAQSGDTYEVEVFGITQGKKRGQPDVVAELKFHDGHWIFVNFHYGEWRPDLLSLSKKIREIH